MNRTVKDEKEAKALLSMALKMGAMMLANGAETYRVEDSIQRVCECRDNVKRADVFATQTAIIASIKFKDENITDMIRIHLRGIDLNILNKLNTFSRSFVYDELSVSSGFKELEAIEKAKLPQNVKQLFFSSLVGPFYCLLLGAGMRDIIICGFITFIMLLLQRQVQKRKIHFFFENVSGGLIVSSLAFLSMILKLTSSVDLMIIGAIMPLVPGVAFTNAIRDTINGDFLSGMSKFMEAIFSALGIVVGVGAILAIRFRGGMI